MIAKALWGNSTRNEKTLPRNLSVTGPLTSLSVLLRRKNYFKNSRLFISLTGADNEKDFDAKLLSAIIAAVRSVW